MTDLAVDMLVARLLWPTPRVRWETARSLARLIRGGDAEARTALLRWISKRGLESEVVLGLGVIDGFDLAGHFDVAEVEAAVKAPSLLSDYLIARNFEDATGFDVRRFPLSPDAPAPLPAHQEGWFSRYRHAAVPAIFHTNLAELQAKTGWPFVERWEHDWRWLQLLSPRPRPERPYHFMGADREAIGQLDLGQREIYVSAYLRTLAHACVKGPMPVYVAEQYALQALTLNRGLADLEARARPAWAPEASPSEPNAVECLARKLWGDAVRDLPSGETPLRVRTVRHTETTLFEIDLCLAIGPPGGLTGRAPMVLREISIGYDDGDFLEKFPRSTRPCDIPLDPPLALTQEIYPVWAGRFHTDILSELTLASPYLFGPVTVEATPDDIRLLDGDGAVVSRWTHWFTEWSPSRPANLSSAVSSLTSVSTARLEALIEGAGAETAIWVRARRGTRGEAWSEFSLEPHQSWMPVPDMTSGDPSGPVAA